MTNNKGPIKVLFVCLGNICRSPTAEAVFRHLVAREAPQLRVEVDSAGTADYHSGDAPDPRSRRAALGRDIDMSGLRARQISPEDFMRFDLILAMDRDTLRRLKAMRPKEATAQVRLFLDYARLAGTAEVPDPYYGGPEEFERVLDLCTAASRGLIAELQQQRAQQPVQAAGECDGNRQRENPRHQ